MPAHAEPPPPRVPSTTQTRFRLRVLGPVTVRKDSDPVASSRVSQPRHVALLCYLALARPRGLQPRDTLVALLWPEHDDTRGRRALRNALHGLRLRLGDSAIVSTGDQLVGLNPDVVSCDAVDLERGRVDLVDGDERGVDPFSGLHVARAAEFDHWLTVERGRLLSLLERRAPRAPNGSAPTPSRLYQPDAWVMHARGHYLFLRAAHGGAPQDLFQCRTYFESALQLDPTFAPALAGLANFYAVTARRGILTPFDEHFARAIELSRQALEMDSTLAVPHVHFGVQALYIEDEFDRAGVEFATAVVKDPGYAEGHRFYGVWLGMAGRHEEAVLAMEQAVALEPDIAQFLSSLGAAHLAAGNLAAAEDAFRRTLRIEPTHAPARSRLIRLLENEGRYEAALGERERPPAMSDFAAYRAAFQRGPDSYLSVRDDALRSEAEAVETRLAEGGPPTPNDLFSPPLVRIVQLHALLGDRRRARSWQAQAVATRPGLTRWFAFLPELRSR